VGFGMAFQYSIGDYIALATELRASGYAGHMTCGGHVPTFCYESLLSECAALDTIVRHEGESTLVEILDLLARGQPVRGVEGLVWREGERIVAGPRRAPVRDLDTLAWPTRRSSPMTVGGVPLAFLLSSRGCVGDCAYCSIRAFSRDAGGAGLRLRAPEEVAREIATLVRGKRVRVFFVQDDLFVLPNEQATIERMGSLRSALDREGVRTLFWIKGRPESITPRVLEAARDLGAIHMFLGVESASEERLRYLGRVHTPADNLRAIALCREHGVQPSFNFMLFDPDCSLDDVEATLGLAEANLDLPWNVCRTEIYPGTRLLERLQGQGRLQGDWRSYGYVMRDERAEVMFRILRVCLHERAFAFDSLLNRLISLSFAAQLHRALFDSSETSAICEEVASLVQDAHRDTVQTLREILAFARSCDPRDARGVSGYAVDQALAIQQRDLDRHRRFTPLWTGLDRRGRMLLAPCD
jgi:anaerobic magnesium-protoporphyrin IX monomethyl ester cyclase